MGLNIGARVKRQEEGYVSYGCNPKGTREEVEADFDAHLRGKFPSDAFNPQVIIRDDTYQFDVRLDYAWNDYDSTPMYLALLEYILTHFSTDYGIDIQVYKSPSKE